MTLYVYKFSWSLVQLDLACLIYCLRLFVVVYKLVVLMLCCYYGLCVYTNFHCCHSLGFYLLVSSYIHK